MKKILLNVFIGSSLLLAVGFTVASYDVKKSTAEVNQIQGIFIFTNSKPLSEYEYLGSIKTSSIVSLGSAQYQPVRDKMIKKIKKDYPQANGAIFYFNNGSADKADAIKFKE